MDHDITDDDVEAIRLEVAAEEKLSELGDIVSKLSKMVPENTNAENALGVTSQRLLVLLNNMGLSSHLRKIYSSQDVEGLLKSMPQLRLQ